MLFPSVDGQAPEITEPNELVQMVSESKESIGNAVGATIQRITVVQPATEKPTDGKNIKGIFSNSLYTVNGQIICKPQINVFPPSW